MKKTPEEIREDYLRRLDAAMGGVPFGVAAEVRAGIAEELEGLDADATAARIAQLGDPAGVAREAAMATGDGVAPVIIESPPRPLSHSRGFAIFAALLLSFGGFVVPVLGWVVGAVMVSMSVLWRTGEKIIAILIPFVAATCSVVFGLVAWTATGTVAVSGDIAQVNPIVPSAYDLLVSGLAILGLLLIPASGLWLLWRLRDRTATSAG